MNNRILRISLSLTKIVKTLLIVFASCIVLSLIGILAEFDFLGSVYLDGSSDQLIFSTSYEEGGRSLLLLNKGFILFWVLQKLTELLLLFLILKTVENVLLSLSDLKTFYSENIEAFQKLSKLFVTWFFVSLPFLRFIDNTLTIGVGVELVYMAGALASLVLAEIFKEGNRLYEENKLTI